MRHFYVFFNRFKVAIPEKGDQVYQKMVVTEFEN